MKRVIVGSTVIRSIGYDDLTETLEIEFHSGKTYDYFDVHYKEFGRFISSDSIGDYYNECIKGRYDCAVVYTEAPAEAPDED